MKAAIKLTAEWEEANWLRLLYLANRARRGLFIGLNLTLLIAYKALKGLGLIIHILLLSEPALRRVERDETWIFRQIK